VKSEAFLATFCKKLETIVSLRTVEVHHSSECANIIIGFMTSTFNLKSFAVKVLGGE